MPDTHGAVRMHQLGFTLEQNHPDVFAGGKRPFHTIIPAFMERGDVHVGLALWVVLISRLLMRSLYQTWSITE
jgi:hypothetical protein